MEASRGRRQLADVAVVAGLLVVVRLGFASWYSASLLDRDAFVHQYGDGVYAHRVLGRELVLLVERLVGDPLGEHLVMNGRHPLAGGLATAGLLVDVGAAVAIALLVGCLLDRRRVSEPGRSLVVLVVAVLVAASASTVTPYDLLACALLLGALVAADRRPPGDLLAVVLVVAGVATRESALVAVAALVAVRWQAADPRRLDATTIAVAIAGVATYVVLLFATGSPTVWEQLTFEGNVGRLYGWFGLAAMVGGWLLWRRAAGLVGLDGPAERRLVVRMWMLAAPYVVVALAAGYWLEVRLLLPLVLAEVWVRTQGAGASAGRDDAPDLEAHR